MYRTFNGKKYREYGVWHTKKSDAVKQANQLRKIGWLARIVVLNPKGLGKRYQVFNAR